MERDGWMCVAIDVVVGFCVFMAGGGKQTRHGRTVSPKDRCLACLSVDTCSIARNSSGLGIPGCLAITQKKCRTCRPLGRHGHATLNVFIVLFLE